MARLGTWTTFDCPDDEVKTQEAYVWLKEKVNEIGGSVRKVMNAHDFGMYPSFEIDKPIEYDFVGDDFEDELGVDDSGLSEGYEDWIEKINAIEKMFCDKFHNE